MNKSPNESHYIGYTKITLVAPTCPTSLELQQILIEFHLAGWSIIKETWEKSPEPQQMDDHRE